MIACTTASRELKNWLWDSLGDDKRKPGSSSRIGSLRAYQGHQPRAEQRRSTRLAALPGPAASRPGNGCPWLPHPRKAPRPESDELRGATEMSTLDYRARTERNIRDSQATLGCGTTNTAGTRDKYRLVGYEPPSPAGHAVRRHTQIGRRRVASLGWYAVRPSGRMLSRLQDTGRRQLVAAGYGATRRGGSAGGGFVAVTGWVSLALRPQERLGAPLARPPSGQGIGVARRPANVLAVALGVPRWL
jgi:hypothetical protein